MGSLRSHLSTGGDAPTPGAVWEVGGARPACCPVTLPARPRRIPGEFAVLIVDPHVRERRAR